VEKLREVSIVDRQAAKTAQDQLWKVWLLYTHTFLFFNTTHISYKTQ
jgi:hypothetical protein